MIKLHLHSCQKKWLQMFKPKSVIRPKHEDYSDIIASFHILSAFLSAFCFHLRFDIARAMPSTLAVATCSKQTLTGYEI